MLNILQRFLKTRRWSRRYPQPPDPMRLRVRQAGWLFHSSTPSPARRCHLSPTGNLSHTTSPAADLSVDAQTRSEEPTGREPLRAAMAMLDRQTLSTLLGYSSILAWLGAQLPQLVENWRNGSVEGLALPFLVSVCPLRADRRSRAPLTVCDRSVASWRRYEPPRVSCNRWNMRANRASANCACIPQQLRVDAPAAVPNVPRRLLCACRCRAHVAVHLLRTAAPHPRHPASSSNYWQ